MTLCGGWFVNVYGLSALGAMFYFKAATSALVVWVANQLKRKEYYYYANLGYGKRRLWTVTLAADLALFVLVVTVAYLIRPWIVLAITP